MAKILVIALVFIVCHVEAAPETRLSCSVANLQQDVQKVMMSCLMHDPELMVEVMRGMQNPEQVDGLGIVCQKKKVVADLLNCVVAEFEQCIPSEAQAVARRILPDTHRWEQIVDLMCEKKNVLNDKCMTPEDSQNFMTCYMGKLQQLTTLASSATSLEDLDPLLCKVLRYDEQCFKANAGSCSVEFVKVVTQMLEMVINVPNCPKTVGGSKVGNALSSVMLQGHPLLFKPQGAARYNRIN